MSHRRVPSVVASCAVFLAVAWLQGCRGDTTVNAGSDPGMGADGGETDAEGPAAQLVGKWSSADIGHFAAVATSLEQTMTYAPNGTLVAQSQTAFRTTSPLFAGCQERSISSGSWFVTGQVGALRLDFDYTDGSTTRTGCQNPAEDTFMQPLTDSELALNSASGGELTLTADSYTFRSTIADVVATYTFVRVP